ncbi:MAG: DNA polymerase III subunit beta [Cyanobium sp. MAG06]|nr:DNA polymerase III subunit beta [Cyanobium sp. MAG06]
MKFITTSELFIKKINTANTMAAKNDFNPLFNCVYLKTEDNILIIKSTNLEGFFEGNISIKTEINGEVYVKADILSKIVNVFSKNVKNLIIEKIENTLKITDSDDVNSFIDLEIFNNEKDFVSLPMVKNKGIEIDNNLFIESIKQVSFCVAKTEIQPQISGVYIYNKDNVLYFVGTDSFRLAEKSIFFESENNISIIIPGNILLLLLSALTENFKLTIDFYEDGIIITAKDSIFAIRTTNNTYPDYKQLFPKEFTRAIRVKKSEILDTVQIASYLAVDGNKFFNFDVLSDSLKIYSDNKNIGKINKTIDMENIILDNNTEMQTLYNPDYFIEGVSKIKGDTLEIS